MLAFLNEWDEHPRPSVHLSTKNKSFLNLAAKYREMGIKNHLFLLALYDTSLADVDPHDENLPEVYKLRVLKECRRNIWYYFREVIRVPQKGGAVIHFRAHRSNIAVLWCVVAGVAVYMEQIRQTGKTTTMSSLVNYIINIYGDNSSINWLTRDDSLRVKTMGDIKDIMDCLPDYCKLQTNKDRANTSELEVTALKNNLKIHVPRSSEKEADKLGRGFTSEWNIIDEIAYVLNIAITLPIILSSGIAARDSVREVNKLFGTIFMSTAGKLHDKDGRYAYSLIQESYRFNESLFDCANKEELYRTIENGAKGNLRVFISFNHRQLGYSDEWLRRTIKENQAKGASANRDFFNIWETGTAEHPLDRTILERISKSKADPIYMDKHKDFPLNWYIMANQIQADLNNIPHTISLDSSEGIGADDYGLVITNSLTGKVTATGCYSHVDTLQFIPWLADMLIKYSNTILIPERKSTGSVIIRGVIDILLKNGIDPFKRIFNRIVNDPHDFPTEWETLKTNLRLRPKDFYIKNIKNFGFVTAGSGYMSRDVLYGEVFSIACADYGTEIKDSGIIGQIEGLVEKNNRIDHGANGHDDMVVAYLLGMWFLMRASNLKYYGINPLSVLSKPASISDDININTSPVDKLLNDQLEEAINQYKLQKNPALKHLIKRRIDKLAATMKRINSAPRNLDGLLASLNE